EITPIAGIDDDRADITAVEKIVDARKFIELPAIGVLLETELVIEHDIAAGKIRVGVVDIDAIAPLGVQRRGKPQRPVLPAQLPPGALARHARQALAVERAAIEAGMQVTVVEVHVEPGPDPVVEADFHATALGAA